MLDEADGGCVNVLCGEREGSDCGACMFELNGDRFGSDCAGTEAR